MGLFYSPLGTAVRTALEHAPLLIFHPRHAGRGVDPDIEERCDWRRALALSARLGDGCPHRNLPKRDSLSADLLMRVDEAGTSKRSNARGHK